MKKHFKFEVKETIDLVTCAKDYLASQGISKSVLLNSDIYVNGKFLRCEKWEQYNVDAGDVVEIYPNIHVTAIAGAIVAALGVTAGTLAATVLTYAFSAVISIGVSFALNWAMSKLFPTEKPSTPTPDSSSALPTIQGANNSYRPNEPLQVIAGTQRAIPDFAVPYYSVVANGAQEIRHLFCVGAGDIEVWDIRKDDTPITSLYGVEYHIHRDWKGTPFAWFDDAVVPTQEQFYLRDLAVFKARSPINSKSFSFIVNFPNSCRRLFIEDNEYSYTGVGFDITLRNFHTLETIKERRWTGGDPNKTSFQFMMSFDLPNVGTWDVEIYSYIGDPATGMTPANTFSDGAYYYYVESVITEAQWVKDEPAVVYQGKSMTFIELKATASDKLTGGLNTINCMARMYGKRADGTLVASSNPALLARRILTDTNLVQNAEYAIIDDASFDAFEAHCDKYGFTANLTEKTGRRVGEVLSDMLEIGQGYISGANGVYEIFYDDPSQAKVDTINSRNSWGMTITAQRPIRAVDGIKMQFLNKDKDYQQDERLVAENGVIPINPETVTNSFIDNSDLAYKYGMLLLAMNKLRNKIYKFNTDWRSIDYKLGQKIEIQHPSFFIGIGTAGKVVRLIKNDTGGVEAVELDQFYSTDLGKQYILTSTLKYSTTYWDIKAVENETTNILYFTVPIYGGLLPEVGEILNFGETGKTGQEVLIRNITRNKDYSAEIECVTSDERYYQAITGEIPPFESKLTFPTAWGMRKPNKPVIYGISIIKESANRDEQGRIRANANIALSYVEKEGVEFSHYSIGVKLITDTEYTYYTSEDKFNFIIPNVLQQATYDVKIVCYSRMGFSSDEYTTQYMPVELMESLQKVPTFTTVYTSNLKKELVFSAISDWRPFKYEVRFSNDGRAWDFANKLAIVDSVQNIPVSQVGMYYIKAISGFASSAEVNSLEIEHIKGAGLVENVVVNYDEKNDNWDGTKIGWSVDETSDALTFNIDEGGFYGIDDFYAIEDFYNIGYSFENAIYTLSEDKTVLLSDNHECNIVVEYTAFGELMHENFYGNESFYGQEDFYGSYGLTNWNAKIEVLIRDSGVWASEWVELKNNNIVGDGFKFRLIATTESGTIVKVTNLKIKIDVPDKFMLFNDLNVSASGTRIDFEPKFNAIPTIIGTILNASQNENVTVDEKTGEYAIIHIRGASGYVDGKVNLAVQGY